MSKTQKLMQVAVLGDSDASPEACAAAEQVGTMLAEMKIVLVCGGRGGAMEAACRGAVSRGGITVGILPSDQMSEANPFCQIVIPTGLGHARNVLTVLAADCVIALGQSAGTLSEICFAWIHGRPILVMKEICRRWEEAIMAGIDSRRTSRIVECDSIEELRRHVSALNLPDIHN